MAGSTGVIRCNPNGTLDNSFDSDGIQSSIAFNIRAIVLQPDGKMVLGGGNFELWRLNTNGSSDITFGNSGSNSINVAAADEYISDLTLQPDGKILAAGNCRTSFGTNDQKFALVRLLADGNLDISFDSDGIVITTMNSSDICRSIALQPDGKILLAGNAIPSNNYSIARYDNTGVLDPTFDGDGKVFTSISTSNDEANSLVLLSDGKFMVSGGSMDPNSGSYNISIAKYNPNGMRIHILSITDCATIHIPPIK